MQTYASSAPQQDFLSDACFLLQEPDPALQASWRWLPSPSWQALHWDVNRSHREPSEEVVGQLLHASPAPGGWAYLRVNPGLSLQFSSVQFSRSVVSNSL